MDLERNVKFEGDLDLEFLGEIKELSKSAEIDKCIQCGTCSSSCPMVEYMDYPPRKIIAMIKAGFKDDALKSFTPWLCASCYSCQVRCPAGINITDVMYSLKRKAVQEKVFPSKFPVPVLAKEMHRMIAKNGRNSELWLVVKLYLKMLNPFGMLKFTSTGLNLMKTGRFSLKVEKIKNKKQFHALLKAVKEDKE
jgi:heterodisulfide reductase subunit C